MDESDIAGLDPCQIGEIFVFPEIPTKVSDVSVPSNTNMRVGKAGSNYGNNGGGTQFEIIDRISSESFQNPRPIGEL